MGSQESIKRERIMLPVDESGNPDYAFMEQYIKEREQQIIQNYIEYIGKNIQTGGGTSGTEWKGMERILPAWYFHYSPRKAANKK